MNPNPYAPNPHVLIVVEKPNERDGQKWESWRVFLDDLKNDHLLREAGERLSECVWQFPLPSALLSINRFLAKIQERGISWKMFCGDAKLLECK